MEASPFTAALKLWQQQLLSLLFPSLLRASQQQLGCCVRHLPFLHPLQLPQLSQFPGPSLLSQTLPPDTQSPKFLSVGFPPKSQAIPNRIVSTCSSGLEDSELSVSPFPSSSFTRDLTLPYSWTTFLPPPKIIRSIMSLYVWSHGFLCRKRVLYPFHVSFKSSFSTRQASVSQAPRPSPLSASQDCIRS